MKTTKSGIDLKKQYTVTIDYENNAEEWWDGGGRELWSSLTDPTPWRCEKTASGKEVAAFLAAAKKIPGWATGPDHAKYPFCVVDAD